MNDLEPSKGGLQHAQYLDPTNDNNLIWAAWGWAASDTQPIVAVCAGNSEAA